MLVVQCSAKRLQPGLVNFVPAVAYHFCLGLHVPFTQLGRPCRGISGLECQSQESGELQIFYLPLQQSALHITHAVEAAGMPPSLAIPRPSLRRTASTNAAAAAERPRMPRTAHRLPLPHPRKTDRSVSCDESRLKSLHVNRQVSFEPNQ